MKDNMTPKININYSYSSLYDKDSDDLGYGIKRTVAKKERNDIIDGKIPLSKILDSKRKVILASEDDDFLNNLLKKFPGQKGQSYVDMIVSLGIAYSNELGELTEDQKTRLEDDMTKFTIGSKVIDAMTKGMESPAQEIFGALLNALHETLTYIVNKRTRSRIKDDQKKFDEVLPKEIATIATTFMDDKAMKKAGWTDEEISSLKEQAKKNEDEGVGATSASESEEERKARGKELKKSNKLEPGKIPNKNNITESDKYYSYNDDGGYLYGPFEFDKSKYKSARDQFLDLTKDDTKINSIKKDGFHVTLGKLYKTKLPVKNSFFSYTPKINLNHTFTIVRSYNLFSKISEFIEERFPVNFSGVDGKKILLNDGRYLKARIVDELNFSVTSYKNDQKQFSVILPLKVHKFKWQNSIRDNIINK